MKYILPADHYAQRREVHPSQRQHHIQPISAPLYVATSLFNPLRWYSRQKNYEAFEKMVADAGGMLYTVEVALRDRHHEVTHFSNPQHLQLRSDHELWYKENSLNALIGRLPHDWEYVAWIDADVAFTRPDWVVETLHQLQHYDFVQMFSFAQDLGPEHQPLGQPTPSFIYAYLDRPPGSPPDFDKLFRFPTGYYGAGMLPRGVLVTRPGLAWAARRQALEAVGGLIDWAILGSGDWHMATALVGHVEKSINSGYSERYKKKCYQWQYHAEKHIRRNIGFVPGMLYHHWHGSQLARLYAYRWKLLVETRFDPDLDLKRDVQGLYQLTERSIALRDGLRAYGRARNEDSIDVR